MTTSICQWVLKTGGAFLRQRKGSILIYTGAFMAIGLGGAALAVDIGLVVLLGTQMQNRADAGALAGAAQLNAQAGALTRAEDVVKESMKAYTTSGADQNELVVKAVTFYEAAEDHVSRGAVTTSDTLARFVEVELEQRILSFIYAPVANALAGASGDTEMTLNSRAVAMSDPYICKAQPLMICDPFDNGDGTVSEDILDPAHVGKSVVLKPAPPGGPAKGNFGLLELPDDDPGGGGANKIQAALEAEEPEGCYGVFSLTTDTGSKVTKVSKGVNVRFGMSVTDSTVIPAPNVINYPDDGVLGAAGNEILGDGVWDLAAYWADRHPGVEMPDVLADAPRYRVYLFEQGVPFWVKAKRTSTSLTEPPGGGWKKIDPTDPVYGDADTIPTDDTDVDNNWKDGHPPPIQTVSTQGQARRLMRLATALCESPEVKGKSEIASPGKYLEIFISRQSPEPADGGGIYGEIVRKLTPQTSLEFHGNVRLVE